MSFVDEKMIKAMNAHKKGIYGSIEEGIFVNEELLAFEEEELFEGKMQIMLPQSFGDMVPEIAKLKYPMEQRPQVIKTNEKTDVNFTFSLLEQPMENKQVRIMRDTIRKYLKIARPDMKILEEGIEESKGLTIGWFEDISNTLDGKLYNLIYYVPIAGKLMQGLSNCPIKEVQNWKPVMFQIMYTIKENKKVDGQ